MMPLPIVSHLLHLLHKEKDAWSEPWSPGQRRVRHCECGCMIKGERGRVRPGRHGALKTSPLSETGSSWWVLSGRGTFSDLGFTLLFLTIDQGMWGSKHGVGRRWYQGLNWGDQVQVTWFRGGRSCQALYVWEGSKVTARFLTWPQKHLVDSLKMENYRYCVLDPWGCQLFRIDLCRVARGGRLFSQNLFLWPEFGLGQPRRK